MHRQPWGITNGRMICSRIFIFLVILSAVIVAMDGRTAAKATRAQLNIVSTVCVIDVVQNGAGQVIQTVSADCDTILPNLLTPLLDNQDQAPLFALPFAGNKDASAQLVAQPRFTQDSVWAPIASTTHAGWIAQQDERVITVMAVGIGVVAIATALGVDVALFELRYSKTAMRWIRFLLIRRSFPKI